MNPIQKIMATAGQTIFSRMNFELLGYAALILAMIHNASISIKN